jgi:hypothetical protein
VTVSSTKLEPTTGFPPISPMISFAFSSRTLILYLLSSWSFGNFTLAQMFVMNGTKISHDTVAAPSVHLNTRATDLLLGWCSKPKYNGDCWHNVVPEHLIGHDTCVMYLAMQGWASIMWYSPAYSIDIYRDIYCLRIGVINATSPGVDDLPALGITETSSAYFSIKAWPR